MPLIEGFALGPFATNCYLLHLPQGGEGWIVDAFGDPAFVAVDLLVTNSSGTPQVVLPVYPLGPAIN